MKEKNLDGIVKKNGNKNIPYKKPKIEKLKLFADQVLGGCLKIIAPDPPCYSSETS